MQPKFRLFAGPNGSGKTFLFNFLKANDYIHTEIYVSADKIEQQIKDNLKFNFNAYRIKVNETDFKDFIIKSSLSKKLVTDVLDDFYIQKGILHFVKNKKFIHSYHASFIAQYLVDKLFETNQDFCFESVMSHASKINIIKKAIKHNYRTYLYFIYTDDVNLNILRVKLRVLQGFHNVSIEKIKKRYSKSFSVMKKALDIVENAFIINNSGDMKVVIEKRNNILQSYKPLEGVIKKIFN